jgi:hypothetical protein
LILDVSHQLTLGVADHPPNADPTGSNSTDSPGLQGLGFNSKNLRSLIFIHQHDVHCFSSFIFDQNRNFSNFGTAYFFANGMQIIASPP